jgi:hypothetical protein
MSGGRLAGLLRGKRDRYFRQVFENEATAEQRRDRTLQRIQAERF